MSEHTAEHTSPRKFFRGLSPFRQGQARKQNPRTGSPPPTAKRISELAPDPTHKNTAHGRSRSHEFFHSRQDLGLTSWAHLIPPIPASSRTASSSSIERLATPSLNRHTIAISPNGSRNIPDILQPLTNAQLEKPFIVSRQQSTTSSAALTDIKTPNDASNNPFFQHVPQLPEPPAAAKYQQTPPLHAQRLQLAVPVAQLPTAKPNPSKPSRTNPTPRQIQQMQPMQPQQPPQQYQQGQQYPQQPQPQHPSQNPPQSQQQQQQQHLQQQQQQQQLQKQRRRKACKACGHVINGQFVRALNSSYHIECFECHECGVQCSSKFFPSEVKDANGQTIQVPLCELDYFKKLDLICFSCNNALRGPYITALGNKYHLEHFKCSACGKVFESDESYYEHANSIYCHFHYSKLFATKCEGCQSSIVKQFVELFKGGKNQQWHPECYMVFKFWNVNFTPDAVGLQDKMLTESPQLSSNEFSSTDLLVVEQKIESTVLNTWLALSGFEEIAASCVSEMLLSACTGKRSSGLYVTGKLVLYVEILFNALDFVQNLCFEFKPENANDSKSILTEEVYSVDAFAKFQTLRKEPRNISGKLMSYLAILRRSNQISESRSLSAELLSVITGCAHYLKLLIRIGLNNAIKLNKFCGDTKALDGFLLVIKRYEEIESTDKLAGDARISIGSRLAVPFNATDACRLCTKSIEKSCVRFMNLRWHMDCFECSICERKPSQEFKVESFLCGADDLIICTECSKNSTSNVGYSSGLVKVSDLSQLAYLLKIAIFRSKSAIKKDDEGTPPRNAPGRPSGMSDIHEETSETENGYSNTLNEVTSLRTKREGQKLSNSIKKSARKSVILEAPEAVTAKAENTTEEQEDRPSASRKTTSASTLSYSSLQESDQFKYLISALKIRDDPPQRQLSNSLDRTSDLLKNEKSLTLDDIPRIVAAEQAREQRPNAFKHHTSLYQKKQLLFKAVSPKGLIRRDVLEAFTSTAEPVPPSNVKYYSELSKSEHYILRHIAVEALLEVSDRYSKDELVEFIQAKKQTTFWDKFKFGGGDKSKQLNVFGVDLNEVTKRYGVDSDLGVGPSQLRIPIVVDDVIHALRQKDMSVEGIFRLNGNIKNLRELTEQINAAPLKSPDFSKYSAVQLAALMKKWLRELPNPLLTSNLYDLWILSRKEGNFAMSKRILQLAYCLLPRSHRNLLEVLLYFFSWVASFAEIDEELGSKMDTHNLATVIAPNVLLSKAASGDGSGAQSSDSHFLAIEVINQLIEIQEELAVIPNDLWEFYEKCQFVVSPKSDSISSKEINGKIAKVSKENKQFFREFLKQEESTAPSHQNTIRRGQTKVHENPQR